MSNIKTVLRKKTVGDGKIWVATVHVPTNCHIEKPPHILIDREPFEYRIYLTKELGSCPPATASVEINLPYDANEENDSVTVRTFLEEGGEINEVDTDEIMVEDGAGGGG